MNASPHVSPRDLWNRSWALSPALTVTTLLMVLGTGVTLALLVLDPRQLLGEPVWLKPAKFYVSFLVFVVTLLYFFSFVPERRRLLRGMGGILSTCIGLEMLIVSIQAARGVRSHFNVATPFDRFIFMSMGALIVVVWCTVFVVSLVLLRAKLADRVLASTLRMGLFVTLVGMGLGFLMTQPRATQLESLQAGAQPVELGSHSFGGNDGSPGLPLVGWSRTAGDMRPAHFIGLHALQVLPLFALGLARRKQRSESRDLAWVRAAGVAYLGLTLTLMLQALRGQSIVSWDAQGLTSLGLVALASLVPLVLHAARRGEDASPRALTL